MREKPNAFYYWRFLSLRLKKILCCFEQQNQKSGAQHAMDYLNILKETLDAWKDVDPVDIFQTMMLSWDTGAVFGLITFKDNFVYEMECEIPVKYVNGVNKVIGIGKTTHRFKNRKRYDIYLLWMPYHLPTDKIWLLITQTYHQIHCENIIFYVNRMEMNLYGHRVLVPIYRLDLSNIE